MAHHDKTSKESEEENEACGGGGRAQNRLERGPDRLLVGGAAHNWSLTRGCGCCCGGGKRNRCSCAATSNS